MTGATTDDLSPTIRQSLGDLCDQMRWIDADHAAAAGRERDDLVGELRAAGVTECAQGSKLFTGRLSAGCQACADSAWSCLFITNWCQADCFYCPQARELRRSAARRAPIAEKITFENADLYAAYVAACGVRAVAISGGEPLSALDEVVRVVESVKERTDGRTFVHLYTNGMLVTVDKLKRLVAAGLDEIRFDLTARDYDVSGLALARDHVRTLTVEIPAIPEDEDRLGPLAARLAAIGVDHLNLHQLQATAENARAYIDRGYTFLRQSTPVVLESEFTALRTVRSLLSSGSGLAVNYCCYVFKHRYQRRGRGWFAARLVCERDEEITDRGFLRRLTLDGRPALSADLLGTDLGDAGLVASYCEVDLSTSRESDEWQEALCDSGSRLFARRRPTAEVTVTSPTVRDAYLKSVTGGWQATAATQRTRLATATDAGRFRQIAAEWSVLERLRLLETVETGLGPIV